MILYNLIREGKLFYADEEDGIISRVEEAYVYQKDASSSMGFLFLGGGRINVPTLPANRRQARIKRTNFERDYEIQFSRFRNDNDILLMKRIDPDSDPIGRALEDFINEKKIFQTKDYELENIFKTVLVLGYAKGYLLIHPR